MLLIFIGLIVLYFGITKYFLGKPSTTFDSDLISLDTSIIQSLKVFNEIGEEVFSLKKEQQKWIASNKVLSVIALNEKVKTLIETIDTIRTFRVLTSEKAQWSSLGLEENPGKRVKIYDSNGLIVDFYIGTTTYQDSVLIEEPFFRFHEDDEVYAIKSIYLVDNQINISSYREKYFWDFSKLSIDSFYLIYQRPDTLHMLSLNSDNWLLDDKEPIPSSKVNQFLNGIEDLQGSFFINDFDDLDTLGLPMWKLRFMSLDSIEVGSFFMVRDSNKIRPFIFKSTQNLNAFFNSDSTGLYQSTFQALDSVVYGGRE